MIKNKIIIALSSLILLLTPVGLYAQEENIDISKMTKEDVMEMSYEQLLNLPFEDLLKLAEIVGVSADELLEMILNREVTSASKKAETLFESPLSTSVITAEEIQNSGVTSIEEAFRLIPGMIVRQKSSGNFDVHIRGNDNIPPKNMMLYSENTMSLVMIDGRVQYNYSHGGTLWETFPISVDDIESIEIIRGPSTALYGPNAVSGAINIVTKKPESKKFHANANIQAGTLNTKQAQADVSYGFSDKFKFKLSGNYDFQDRHTSDMYVWRNAETQSLISNSGYYSYQEVVNGNFAKDFSKRFEDENFGKDRYGTNLYLYYDIDDESYFNLSGGFQESSAIVSIFTNHNIPFAERVSHTQYINMNSRLYGFDVKFSYQTGTQNIEEGTYFSNPYSTVQSAAYKLDLQDIHASIEYDWDLGKLNIRPGISYQKAIRDDSDYVDVVNSGGFFNGEGQLSSFAYFLRADYKPTDKIRLIAAIRGDKYETPDVNKITYQFIGSYKFNEKHILRGVYSRANRGPFMADASISFDWYLDNGMLMEFEGNPDMELATMDMIELGYNLKPAKNIQIGTEIFYTKTKDFGCLTPSQVLMIENPAPTSAADAYLPAIVNFSYLNIPTESVQYGFTANINWVVTEKLQLRPFFTIQKTELKDYLDYSPAEVIGEMGEQAVLSGLTNGEDAPYVGVRGDLDTKDVDHKSTPSYYGGLFANYQPIEKLNINLNSYFYGEQEFVYQDETTTINPKVILNAKISYKFWNEHKIFINARNLISDENEFAFTDKIGPTILGGINISF